MRARSRLVAPLAVLAAAFVLGACGEDDFENEPRPPVPIELTARIADDVVNVSPSAAGAGLATITISNQSQEPATLVLEGPTDEESPEITAGGTGEMKIALEEGDYTVSTLEGSQREAKLEVGPERETSQNDLLLP